MIKAKLVQKDLDTDAIFPGEIETAKEQLQIGDYVDLAVSAMGSENTGLALVELHQVKVVAKYPHIFRGDDGNFYRYDTILRGKREMYDFRNASRSPDADTEEIRQMLAELNGEVPKRKKAPMLDVDGD